MAISSASTFAEVVAEWKDTADYDLSADTDLCRRHIKACRYLQQMTPRETEAFGSGGGSRTQTDPDHLTADLAKAESWLQTHDVAYGEPWESNRTIHTDLSGLRD
jgi:hypothetical protein